MVSDGPTFGKASLTESERKILRAIILSNARLGYEKGIICMKHRLSRGEILQLVGNTHLSNPNLLSYPIGASQLLEFTFGHKGELIDARLVGTELKLPTLDSFVSDRPSETIKGATLER